MKLPAGAFVVVGAFVGGIVGSIGGCFGAIALLVYVLDPTGHGLTNSSVYLYIVGASVIVGLVIGIAIGYQIGKTLENKRKA